MKKTITRKRILEIVSNTESIKTLTGVKLTYAIVKNLRALKNEAETLEETNAPSEGFKKYKAEFQEIVESEAKRDEKGAFISAGAGQILLINPESFNAKVKSLEKKFEAELDEANKKDEEYQKLLKEPFEFDFYEFDESELPTNITLEQRELLWEMQKETEI